MPRRKEGGRKKEEEKLRSPELQLIIVGLSLFSLCFPCLSRPLHCQSASGPFASIFLSLPVGSHQSVDLPWMPALSANYTVYLTTLTAMAKKISPLLFANPQLGKQHFSEYSPPTDEFKLTCSSIQQLIGILAPQQSIRCLRWHKSTEWYVFRLLLSSVCTVDPVNDLIWCGVLCSMYNVSDARRKSSKHMSGHAVNSRAHCVCVPCCITLPNEHQVADVWWDMRQAGKQILNHLQRNPLYYPFFRL